MSQHFYPFYDSKTKEFDIHQCFDYELDEYRGAPLARNGCFESEEDVIEFITEREDQLPFEVQVAFRSFKQQYHGTYDGILD